MSDSYQAIYDAVRSRISGGNIADAVAEACRNAFDISHQVACITQELSAAAYSMGEPSAIYRPSLTVDGDHWCALYGSDLQSGVSGFGKSPALAIADFNKNWHAVLPEKAT
ncbi:MAG: hypothetical protein RLZZ200_500 [Pseudomonadota bacterium]|jgi:hypothetical protein